jgi:glutathione peroxidase
MTSTYDFTATRPDGSEVPLRDYAGKMLLIVNVASKCGLTPQYEGLESLYRDDNGRGLEILGFPCNQFKEQEPGTDAEIQDFCKTTYDVTFPVFGKIEVNGSGADPLYQYLRAQAPGDFGPGYGDFY